MPPQSLRPSDNFNYSATEAYEGDLSVSPIQWKTAYTFNSGEVNNGRELSDRSLDTLSGTQSSQGGSPVLEPSVDISQTEDPALGIVNGSSELMAAPAAQIEPPVTQNTKPPLPRKSQTGPMTFDAMLGGPGGLSLDDEGRIVAKRGEPFLTPFCSKAVSLTPSVHLNLPDKPSGLLGRMKGKKLFGRSS
jgi:hypothetical protein